MAHVSSVVSFAVVAVMDRWRARLVPFISKPLRIRLAAAFLSLAGTVLLAVSTAAIAAPRGTAVAFFPDGKRVLAGSTAGFFEVLSVPDGKLLDHIETAQKSVNDIAVSADGSRVATGNGDGTVTIWSAADFSKQATLTGHTKFVMAVAFSPDGKRIASAGGDMTVRLWDATTGALIAESGGHGGRVNALAFSADGKLLASASEDASVRVWDGQSGAEIATLRPPDTNTGLREVAISRDSRRLAAGNYFDTFVWDLANKTTYKTSGALYAISFSPDGQRLALGSDSVVLADAGTGKFQASFQPGEEEIGGNPAAIAVSPDWKWFAVLPDRGTIYIAKVADILSQTDTEACEYDDLRDPMCLGEPCETTKVVYAGGCIQATNTSERRVRVTTKLRCGPDAVLYLDPGATEKISYPSECVNSRGDLISIDMEYAKEGDGPSGAREAKPPTSSSETSPSAKTNVESETREAVRQTGTVKFYNSQQGYGFIKPDDGGNEIFLHVTEVERSGIGALVEGMRISFETEPGSKGPRAVNLRQISR